MVAPLRDACDHALGDRFSDTFADMVLQRREGETELTGAVRDQAQLFAILDQIQRFGVELVSVNPVVDRWADERPW